MKTLFVALGVLGLSAVGASAECSSKHQARASTDQIKTASIATPTVDGAKQDKAQTPPILSEDNK